MNLKDKYDQLSKEFKKLQDAYNMNAVHTLSNFHTMSDQFLDPNLFKVVKFQSLLRSKKNKGRKYSNELREFSLTIWFLGP